MMPSCGHGEAETADLRIGGNCPSCLLALALVRSGDDDSRQVTELRVSLESDSPSGPGAERRRMTPGSVVADRFRIVAPLGSGGMGDVYRAEDLKLGQAVALKFLPDESGRAPEIVRCFYDEVRLGRLVAHPNVCRIYDLLDIGGRPAVVMELVEGETLSGLLKRITRLPYRKALEVARDLCAGLDAAHAKGIVHGDLKPSNIMIDGRGRVRITDFGLSRLADDDGERRLAGTFAYMAPEQLTRGEMSTRTDIYSLGLVLYEIFTGRRPREAPEDTPVEEWLMQTPPKPSAVRPGLNRAIEDAILCCLSPDPEGRPSTVRAVLAMLPGGDVLENMVAAGETPTPELVAASHRMRPLTTRESHSLTIAALVALAVLSWTALLDAPWVRAGPKASLQELERRVDELVLAFGDPSPAGDRASWLEDASGSSGDAPGVTFHHRSSPEPLLALRSDGRITANDPSFDKPGMRHVVLDPGGRLLRYRAWAAPDEPLHSGVNWERLLAEAGIDRRDAAAHGSRWVPPVPYDDRREWIIGETVARAGALNGRLTYFEIVPRAPSAAPPQLPVSSVPELMYFLIIATSLVVGAYFARRNLRGGRVDRKGANRLAAFVFSARAAHGLLVAHHPLTLNEETVLLTSIAGASLLLAAEVWLAYVALEPHVRGRWPGALVGWARVLQGRIRDPIVGRDVLSGFAVGILIRLVEVIPPLATSAPGPWRGAIRGLGSSSEILGAVAWAHARAVFYALFALFLLAALRSLLHRKWLASSIWLLATTASWIQVDAHPIQIPVLTAQMLILLLVLQKLGLLAATAAIFMQLTLFYVPLALDPSAFYFTRSLLSLLTLAGLVLVAFLVAEQGKTAVRRQPGSSPVGNTVEVLLH